MALITGERLQKALDDPGLSGLAIGYAVDASLRPTTLHRGQNYYAAGAEAAGAPVDEAVRVGIDVALLVNDVNGAESAGQLCMGALGYMINDSRLTLQGSGTVNG